MNLYMYALVAAILFFILTPGVLLTIPPASGCGLFVQLTKNKSCSTSYMAAGVHTLVFLIVFTGFIMWRKQKSSTYIYMYAVAAALLFFILTPGILLTLPPSSNCGPFIQLSTSKSCATSYIATAVHTLVYLIVFVGFIMWRKKTDGI
jgi:Protein of unknown function (DUF3339)